MGTGLYQHQRDAVDKMRSGSVLCGGVGTGKSRTALAFYVEKICDGYIPPPRSSTPVSVRKHVPLYIITTARKRDTYEWEDECSNFLISYDEDSLAELHVDSWNNIGKYSEIQNAFFIFDEQRVVSTGKWAKTFVKIAKRNQWVLLSATPGDSWMDYWAVFVANGFYRNITEFRQQHVVYRYGAKFPQIEKYINTHILKRHRSEILVHMPFERQAVRHHQWIKTTYDEDSYSIVLKKRWHIYEDRPLENISETCYLLRKITNSDGSRIEAIKNVMDHRPTAIIFYNYDYELEALRNYCEQNEKTYAEWNGHKHQPIPKTKRWIYLVQYIAGSEGWNCTETDTIIFYSQNYSYKLTEQACGRIDRLNTPFTDLFYFHIFSDAPIDKAIKACLKRKENFNESAFAENFFSRKNQPY